MTPFLLEALISFAPTHLASHTALSVGTLLLVHCSRSTLFLMPWGIVLLSRRNGINGFARSRSQVSLFVSVKVTRGGGLNVGVEVIWPWSLLWPITRANRAPSVCRPFFCLNAGYMVCLADEVSFCVVWLLSKWPCRIALSVKLSSGWFPIQGKKSACPIQISQSHLKQELISYHLEGNEARRVAPP